MRLEKQLSHAAVFVCAMMWALAAAASGPYCFQNWIDTACNASYVDCGDICGGCGSPMCQGTGEYTPESIYCPTREIEACQCIGCGARAPLNAAPGQAETTLANEAAVDCDPTSQCCDGCDPEYSCGCCTPFCQCVIELCIYP